MVQIENKNRTIFKNADFLPLINVLKHTAFQCDSCSTLQFADADTLAYTRDCAAICRQAINMLEGYSLNSFAILKACAEMCARCADACESQNHIDDYFSCAVACFNSAAFCHEFVMGHLN